MRIYGVETWNLRRNNSNSSFHTMTLFPRIIHRPPRWLLWLSVPPQKFVSLRFFFFSCCLFFGGRFSAWTLAHVKRLFAAHWPSHLMLGLNRCNGTGGGHVGTSFGHHPVSHIHSIIMLSIKCLFLILRGLRLPWGTHQNPLKNECLRYCVMLWRRLSRCFVFHIPVGM